MHPEVGGTRVLGLGVSRRALGRRCELGILVGWGCEVGVLVGVRSRGLGGGGCEVWVLVGVRCRGHARKSGSGRVMGLGVLK